MSKVTNIVKIEVEYYDKESIIIMGDNYYTFYLPDCNKSFLKRNWSQSDKDLFNNTFSELVLIYAVISWCGLLSQNLNRRTKPFSFLF